MRHSCGAISIILVAMVAFVANASANSQRIQQLRADLTGTSSARKCIRRMETRGETVPYRAVNNEGSGAKGAYQYMDGTWRYVLSEAERYYGMNISSARTALDASAWAQDAVTAFAVAHPEKLDHKPWRWSCY